MFTSNHFELTYHELRDVMSNTTGVAALRAAMHRTLERLMTQVLQIESSRLDLYRGAALILYDIENLLEGLILAEKAKVGKGDPPENKIYEV
jgi:hypothetical protein